MYFRICQLFLVEDAKELWFYVNELMKWFVIVLFNDKVTICPDAPHTKNIFFSQFWSCEASFDLILLFSDFAFTNATPEILTCETRLGLGCEEKLLITNALNGVAKRVAYLSLIAHVSGKNRLLRTWEDGKMGVVEGLEWRLRWVFWLNLTGEQFWRQ